MGQTVNPMADRKSIAVVYQVQSLFSVDNITNV